MISLTSPIGPSVRLLCADSIGKCQLQFQSGSLKRVGSPSSQSLPPSIDLSAKKLRHHRRSIHRDVRAHPGRQHIKSVANLRRVRPAVAPNLPWCQCNSAEADLEGPNRGNLRIYSASPCQHSAPSNTPANQERVPSYSLSYQEHLSMLGQLTLLLDQPRQFAPFVTQLSDFRMELRPEARRVVPTLKCFFAKILITSRPHAEKTSSFAC